MTTPTAEDVARQIVHRVAVVQGRGAFGVDDVLPMLTEWASAIRRNEREKALNICRQRAREQAECVHTFRRQHNTARAAGDKEEQQRAWELECIADGHRKEALGCANAIEALHEGDE